MISKELSILYKFGREWGIAQDTDGGEIEYIKFNESVIFKELKDAMKATQTHGLASGSKNGG